MSVISTCLAEKPFRGEDLAPNPFEEEVDDSPFENQPPLSQRVRRVSFANPISVERTFLVDLECEENDSPALQEEDELRCPGPAGVAMLFTALVIVPIAASLMPLIMKNYTN